MKIPGALALLLLTAAAAPPQRYGIDPARSDVAAKVAFLGLASKTAHFPKVSGGIVISPDAPEKVDLTVRLDATALTAPDAVTLARLKGPDFFAVAQYPQVVFHGRSMRMTGERDALVTGEITARGVTRPATLAVRFAASPFKSDGRAPLTIDGTTTIDRTDFGMTAYRFIVGRKVAITIHAVMTPA